nr:response regulator transcription factor [uncultured Blautia sp.]
MKKIEILVVEDEPKLAQTVSDFLRIQNYEVHGALTGNKALECFQQNKQKIDLILLDLMLPDISGYTVLKEIRKISEVPVIILSARAAVSDQMNGFEKGADDYITKPFSLALMKLHIEAVLKRAGKLRTMVEYKDLQADVNGQFLYYKEQFIETTKKEFDLMVYFMEHPGIVLPRNTILDAVWEYDYTGDVRTIDTLVKQLRKKLGDGGSYIRTVYGVGYIFGEEYREE